MTVQFFIYLADPHQSRSQGGGRGIMITVKTHTDFNESVMLLPRPDGMTPVTTANTRQQYTVACLNQAPAPCQLQPPAHTAPLPAQGSNPLPRRANIFLSQPTHQSQANPHTHVRLAPPVRRENFNQIIRLDKTQPASRAPTAAGRCANQSPGNGDGRRPCCILMRACATKCRNFIGRRRSLALGTFYRHIYTWFSCFLLVKYCSGDVGSVVLAGPRLGCNLPREYEYEVVCTKQCKQ